jgi:poly(3-hydroxybutyrate) depolymerase
MLYETFQAHSDVFAPVRLIARATQQFLNQPWPLVADHPFLRHAAAACELVSRAGVSHRRPDFGIKDVMLAGEKVGVREEVIASSPFCSLLHFRKDSQIEQPRLLVVAPLSGHFATLLRGTVARLLLEHDVYITDWVNARDIALLHGRFDLDDHIDLMMNYMRSLAPELNVLAVCQPSVPVLAAVALLAADNDAGQPRTVTLMGGPIDPRVNPTKVNAFALAHPLSWFERNVITTVPLRHAGAFRRVYPGFLQLAGFLSMNLDRHITAHLDLFKHLVRGDGESARATKKFYDEYTSVMDLSADFYLQTIDRVFLQHALPKGKFVSRGRPVEPRAIAKSAVFTVEGENDDICAVGQTSAVHGLLTGLPAAKHRQYVQVRVGHYGVFNGRRWRDEVYPKVRDFIRAAG